MTHPPDANDPAPTDDEIVYEMTHLKAGEEVQQGDWIEDINEWADDTTGALIPEIVGKNFYHVWRFNTPRFITP